MTELQFPFPYAQMISVLLLLHWLISVLRDLIEIHEHYQKQICSSEVVWESVFDVEGYALCRRPFSAPRGCHLGGLVHIFRHPGGTLFCSLGTT